MLIIGAKGFAKEVLEIFHQKGKIENLAFYDDVNRDIGNMLYNKFPILKNEKEVKDFFKKYDNKFTIGIGNPVLRSKLYHKFKNLGGEIISSISPLTVIGSYDVNIGKGCNILAKATISNSTTIGKGCIIYYDSIITHDCLIDDFVEISPGVIVLGRVTIGAFSHLGAGAIILPDIKIGKNTIIGAGAVVTKDVPDNEVWIGNPAKYLKKNNDDI